jgi:hypothetical protein
MNQKRVSNFASVMIAVATVLGAMTACLGTVAAGQAGEADFDGITAYIKSEEAVVINNINAFEHLRAYAIYYRYVLLADLLIDDASAAGDQEFGGLIRQKNEIAGIAGEMRHNFFSAAYLNENSSYNLERELDEAWAEDLQSNDLDSGSHFELADGLRSQSIYLMADITAFSISFFLFTLAEVIKHRWRILFLVLGILAMLIGLLVVLVVEAGL